MPLFKCFYYLHFTIFLKPTLLLQLIYQILFRQFKIHIHYNNLHFYLFWNFYLIVLTYLISYCFLNFLPQLIFTPYNIVQFLLFSTLVILKLIGSTFLFNSDLVFSVLCFSFGLIISGTFLAHLASLHSWQQLVHMTYQFWHLSPSLFFYFLFRCTFSFLLSQSSHTSLLFTFIVLHISLFLFSSSVLLCFIYFL